MARKTLHDQYLSLYLFYVVIQTLLHPKITPDEAAQHLNLDISCILAIQQTRYLQGRSVVPKASTLHLAWQYTQNESNHHHFTHLLCVSPTVFEVLLDLIQDHPIFTNNSQTPVQTQL
ncbi:hypothetical protein PAXRUDRAFT_96959, partial [Paxillus rubicundulus Ve08.2h10]